MVELLGMFSGFSDKIGTWGMYAAWGLAFLLIAGCLVAVVIMFLINKSQKKVMEINIENKRIRFFKGRLKSKTKGGVKQFWMSKVKRFIPEITQDTIFTQGNKETIILLKDNNGLYHTAKVPNYEQIKKWYSVVHNVNLDDPENRVQDKIKDIYLLPSPHEDLDWLANQCIEADKEFRIDHWWQSPTIAYIGVGFICFLMIVVTIILNKKL